MRITTEWLKEREACPDQVDLFAATFPTGAEVTLENLLLAANAGLDLDWFAYRVLSATAYEAYLQATAPAREAYRQATVPAFEAYEQAKAPAREAYRQARATEWKAYEQAIAPAWKAYRQATAPAWEAYQQATARALWEAFCLLNVVQQVCMDVEQV